MFYHSLTITGTQLTTAPQVALDGQQLIIMESVSSTAVPCPAAGTPVMLHI
jgi:hypothetical protein